MSSYDAAETLRLLFEKRRYDKQGHRFITYLMGAAACAVLYFVLGSDGDLLKECGKLNWSSFILGIVIVGLEAGWIYAYKAGWQVSTGFIVQSAFLATALLLVGFILYHESLTWNKLVGVAICLVGLIFINLKAEIADYLGYYDTSSFRHAFRNYYGTTPQLFRLDR